MVFAVLSIDAEGLDEVIIKSIDLLRKKFSIVICIETIFFTSGNKKISS
jgi:hypothetical protein